MTWAYGVEPRRAFYAETVSTVGTTVSMRCGVRDYQGSREHHAVASDDIAEVADQRSTAIVWGAPFFLERRIALVIEGGNTPGVPGLVGRFYRLG